LNSSRGRGFYNANSFVLKADLNPRKEAINGNEPSRNEFSAGCGSKRGSGAMLCTVNTFRLLEAVLERKKQWAVI
jgi:hypothetical protein